MALSHSKYVLGSKRVPASQWAGDMVAVRYEVTIPEGFEDGDIIELGILPAYHTVKDAVIDSDALDEDSTPNMRVDVGLMSGQVGEPLDEAGDPRTCGAELFDEADVGTGGVIRAEAATAFKIAPVAYDRSIGVECTVTPQQSTLPGTFGLTVYYCT